MVRSRGNHCVYGKSLMVTQKFFGRLGPFGLSCLFVVGVVLFSLNFFSCLCFICFFMFRFLKRAHGYTES